MFGLLTELSVVGHIVVALLLGWVVGYERYYHGRASGTQVYCLVCMASCAVTVLAGYPGAWYGGAVPAAPSDPFRVIGSILTGVGFLGAGLIVQSGVNIRGLTTAASVWASSAIGILVGVSFYASALSLAGLLVLCMVAVPKLEHLLPASVSLVISVRFQAGYQPNAEVVHEFLRKRDLSIPENSLSVSYADGKYVLEFVVIAGSASKAGVLSEVSRELPRLAYVESFSIVRSVRG